MSTEDNDYPDAPELADAPPDDVQTELADAKRLIEQLAKKNQAITMDLIMIATVLGVHPPGMNGVLERIRHLLSLEATTKGE